MTRHLKSSVHKGVIDQKLLDEAVKNCSSSKPKVKAKSKGGKRKLPALEDGKLTKILSKEGEEIEVGSDIAIFESV